MRITAEKNPRHICSQPPGVFWDRAEAVLMRGGCQPLAVHASHREFWKNADLRAPPPEILISVWERDAAQALAGFRVLQVILLCRQG